MTLRELNDGINSISDELVFCADNTEALKMKITGFKRRFIASAAAIAILITGFLFLKLNGQLTKSPELPYDSSVVGNSDNAQNTAEGVYFEEISITDMGWSPTACTTGFLIADGKVYMTSQFLDLGNASVKSSILGEPLGQVYEIINYPLDNTDLYEVANTHRFVSPIGGLVYSIKGYDSKFRLGVVFENQDGLNLAIYDCLNGITMKKGEELYGDRLHLKDNYTQVSFKTHEQWDNDETASVYKNIDKTLIADFIDDLYNAAFVAVENAIDWEDVNQLHMYLAMKDGTTTELRIFSNGYVVYNTVGNTDCCVKVSGTSFNRLLKHFNL